MVVWRAHWTSSRTHDSASGRGGSLAAGAAPAVESPELFGGPVDFLLVGPTLADVPLRLGFALLAFQFEQSHIPGARPRLLPARWKGGFAMLAIVFGLSSLLDNIAAAMIGGAMAQAPFPEARSVGRWLRHGWHAAVAYLAGVAVLLATLGWNPTPEQISRPDTVPAPVEAPAVPDPR